jgi:hypothetical protein
MPKLKPEQLKEIYMKLPNDLKDAIFSVDSAEIIQAIGKKYNLAIDKTGELADETGLVMLGITHPDNFISNLAERLGIDKDTAGKIAGEVNNQIFAKVRESLKKIQTSPPEPPSPNRRGDEGEVDKKLPEIIQGTTTPAPPSNLPVVEVEQPKKVEEKKYPGGDPYREPTQ